MSSDSQPIEVCPRYFQVEVSIGCSGEDTDKVGLSSMVTEKQGPLGSHQPILLHIIKNITTS
jgi:hypothetical protein